MQLEWPQPWGMENQAQVQDNSFCLFSHFLYMAFHDLSTICYGQV